MFMYIHICGEHRLLRGGADRNEGDQAEVGQDHSQRYPVRVPGVDTRCKLLIVPFGFLLNNPLANNPWTLQNTVGTLGGSYVEPL